MADEEFIAMCKKIPSERAKFSAVMLALFVALSLCAKFFNTFLIGESDEDIIFSFILHLLIISADICFGVGIVINIVGTIRAVKICPKDGTLKEWIEFACLTGDYECETLAKISDFKEIKSMTVSYNREDLVHKFSADISFKEVGHDEMESLSLNQNLSCKADKSLKEGSVVLEIDKNEAIAYLNPLDYLELNGTLAVKES